MDRKANKLTIGFIIYGAKATVYLPYFLDSLFGQDYQYFDVMAVDCNNDTNKRDEEILRKYPRIEIIHQGINFGFGKSFNLMIDKAVKKGAEYFLVLNTDMVMEIDFVRKLLRAFKKDDEMASASPKIYRWNFIPGKLNEKTNIIDSFGIKLKPGLRFFDVGQGQVDQGQFDNARIIGPSGAAAMYRVKALEKIKSAGQYFDEQMFMYKEDCDLAYRLFLAGYSSKLAADAKIYHDRTASGSGEGKIAIALNRRNKNKQIKKWSLLHQLIIVKKFWGLQDLANKFAIIWHIVLMFIFSLIFEQYLLAEFVRILKIRVKKY